MEQAEIKESIRLNKSVLYGNNFCVLRILIRRNRFITMTFNILSDSKKSFPCLTINKVRKI